MAFLKDLALKVQSMNSVKRLHKIDLWDNYLKNATFNRRLNLQLILGQHQLVMWLTATTEPIDHMTSMDKNTIHK